MTNHLSRLMSLSWSASGKLSVARLPARLISLALVLVLLMAGSPINRPHLAAANALLPESGPATPAITLLSGDDRSLTVAFDFAPAQVGVQFVPGQQFNGQSCAQVTLTGSVKDEEAGRPILPLVSSLVGLPPAVDVQVQSMALDSYTLPGSHILCPGLDKGVEMDASGAPNYVERPSAPDPQVYAQDRAYPVQVVNFADLGYMRSQRLGRVQVSPVQYNPVSGQITLHRRILVTLTFSQSTLRRSVGVELAETAPFEATLSHTLLNYDQARSWRVSPAQQISAAAGSDASAAVAIWSPPSPTYKVTVNRTGIYQLTRADLAAATLPVDSLDPRTLRLFTGGKEVPLTVIGEGDGRFDAGDLLFFYGEGVDTRYTDTNVYWLTYGGANGARMQQASVGGNGLPVASYAETVHFERNINYVSSLPKVEGFDHWYDVKIDAFGGGAPASRLYSMATPDLAPGAFTATLTVAVAGHTLGTHHMILRVNGQVVGDFQWNGRTYLEAEAQVPQALLAANNGIQVQISTDLGGQLIDTIYVDWLSLTYQRQLMAQTGRLAFGDAHSGAWTYALKGFTGEVTVYDVTAPGQVAIVPTTLNGSDYTFTRNAGSARRYVAVEASQRLAPLGISPVNSVSLKAGAVGADYIIISHPDFLAAMQPLADYRASTGLRVRLVNVQDVYDQFNHGLPAAEAIRDFLAYAYTNWAGPAPSYVLLAGDGTYDLRGYLPTSAPTYIPPFLAMVDPDLGQTAAENRFVTLNGDDLLADMYIGRFPVNSAAEATVMVQKTINYETASPSGDWQKKAIFVTDDLENGGGAFYAFSDRIADGTVDGTPDGDRLLPAEYERTKIYMGQTCAKENPSVECRNQIAQAINQGAAIVSYVGHGTKQEWAAERLFDPDLVVGLNNGDKLPVILAMTCQEGYFQLPEGSALAEVAVRAAAGGAVASWSPTGFGLATGHDLMEWGFMLAVFHEDMPFLGPATQRGKLYLYQNSSTGRYDDLLDTFMLFGDPALRLVGTQESGATVYLPLLVR